ncbi:hypothetical protein KC19_VG119500 [Ceratodon purpureus]|uniref:Uncharacterized protein n=1 Tax=Ceratodon purpureus TaxID=3225 RepID=A0A8T0HPI8_CERPU|nr:hypothetical protein KC19_VG119500 [Ceratodon purpureus]
MCMFVFFLHISIASDHYCPIFLCRMQPHTMRQCFVVYLRDCIRFTLDVACNTKR